MKTKILLTSATALLFALQAQAAAFASDNASAYAYDDGWQTNDNGGFGFTPWTLTPAGNAGFFIATSIQNGDGADDGVIGGLPGDFDIDTTVGPVPDQSGDPDPNLTENRSWGMFANNGGQADATRGFTGGPMAVGQTFSIDFDNGFVDGPSIGTVGVGLQNAAGTTLWEVFFAGGSANYQYQDASGFGVFNNVGFATEGLNVKFTLTASNAYSATLTRRDGVTQVVTGSLIANADQNINLIRAFNSNAGTGAGHDFFINSMEIPEPGASALGIGLCVIAVAALRRRR